MAGAEAALRHRGLLVVALTALFYNMGFFTLLAFAPFPLDMTASQVGWIFFGWGLMLAFTSVVVAPVLQRMFGTVPTIVGALSLFAVDLAAMAVFTDDKAVLVVGIVAAGAFLGVNNTLITEAVMGVAPVERPVASAAYSFVRFSGGAVAPWAAGRLGLSGPDVDAYVKALRRADLASKGDEDVFQKLRKDFDDKGVAVSDAELRRAMSDHLAQAVSQIEADRKG